MLQRADMVKPELDSWADVFSSLNIYLEYYVDYLIKLGVPRFNLGKFLSFPQLPSLLGNSAAMWWEPAALGPGIHRHSGNETSYWTLFGFVFEQFPNIVF